MYTNTAYFLTNIKKEELDNLMRDSEGNVQQSYLEQRIKSADDKIDSYLRKVLKTIPVPEAKVTETIRQCSYDIAIYYLHDRIQLGDIPERIKEKYDDAIAWLKSVARGDVETGITEAASATGITFLSNENIFNRNSF